MVDLDRENADNVRVGLCKDLLLPEQIVAGNTSSNNNWAKGYCTIGKEIIDLVLERIRKQAEMSNSIESLILTHAISGGTGGGLCSLLLESLSSLYPKYLLVSTSIWSKEAFPPAEVNCSAFTVSRLISQASMTFPIEFGRVEEIAKVINDTGRPTFIDIDRIIAMFIGELTSSIRYCNGDINCSIMEIYTSLVPFPKLSFIMGAMAPFMPPSNAYNENPSIDTITNSLLDSSNQLVSLDPLKGKFMSTTLKYISPPSTQSIKAAISSLRNRQDIQYVSWCPKIYRVGVRARGGNVPFGWKRGRAESGAQMLANNSIISSLFSTLSQDYSHSLNTSPAHKNLLLSEGMEEGEWAETQEDLDCIITDYSEIDGQE